MKIGGLEFKGPYWDIDKIDEDAGVYVVLSLHPNGTFEVIDVGESGWNIPEGQGMRKRLKSDSRKECWKQHLGTGSLAFAVLIERNGEKRLRIEQLLRRAYKPPCGTDPWDIGIQNINDGKMA